MRYEVLGDLARTEFRGFSGGGSVRGHSPRPDVSFDHAGLAVAGRISVISGRDVPRERAVNAGTTRMCGAACEIPSAGAYVRKGAPQREMSESSFTADAHQRSASLLEVRSESEWRRAALANSCPFPRLVARD